MKSKDKKTKLQTALYSIRMDFKTRVLRTINSHPAWPYRLVAEYHGTSVSFAQRTAWNYGIRRRVNRLSSR
jgi:hypothetical protein